MTTSLEDLLSNRRDKLPDISDYHYTLSKPSSSIEDINQQIAREESARQYFTAAWTNSIVKSKSDGVIDDVTKLLNAFKTVDKAFDEEADRQIRNNFRKGIENPDGHPDVIREEQKAKESKEINKVKEELFELDREAYIQGETGDILDFNTQAVFEEDPVQKIERNNAQIADLGYTTAMSMYQDLSHKQIYNVPGYGVISLQYALEKDLRFSNGQSVAEAIRQEIFSDIYKELQLDKVPTRYLEKRFFEPLRKTLDSMRVEEVKIRSEENRKKYLLRKNEAFLNDIINGAGVAISGSKEVSYKDGFLKKWSTDGTIASSVDNIIKELRFAEQRGNKKELQRALSSIINGNYATSDRGVIPIEEWAKTNKDIKRLYDHVIGQHDQVAAANARNIDQNDKNAWNTNYKGAFVSKVVEQYGPRGVPESDIPQLITQVLTEAKADKVFSAKFRNSLDVGSPEVTELINLLPKRQAADDREYERRALDLHKKIPLIEDEEEKKLAINERNWFLNEIKDPVRKTNVQQIIDPSKVYPGYSERITSVTGSDGFITKAVDKYWKDQGRQDQGGVVYDNAAADYKALYTDAMLSGLMSEQEAHLHAYSTVMDKLNPGNWFNRGWTRSPYEGTTVPSDELVPVSNAVANMNKVIKEQYQDNPLGILNHSLLDGEVAALNALHNNPTVVPPLYKQLVRTHFPHLSPYQVALLRQKNLIEKDWTDQELELWREKYGEDLSKVKWMTKETLNDINKQLNTLEEKWLIKEGIYNPEVDVIGFEVDLPDRDTGALIEEGVKLNENSDVGQIGKYITETNGTNLAEPVFEMMYDRAALKGAKFDHVSRRGRALPIQLKKPLVEHNLNELLAIDGHKFGVFGLNKKEIAIGLQSMGFDLTPGNKELSKIKFDSTLQGQLMWHKIKETIKGHNNLSTISAKDVKGIRQLSRKERKQFIGALKKQAVTLADIEDEYMIWDTDEEIKQGTPSSQVVKYSPWHTPDLLAPTILPYLESQDYKELDLTNKINSKKKQQK